MYGVLRCVLSQAWPHDVVMYTGDYVVVEPIEEGNKVQGEITHILFPRQIKYLKEKKHWYMDTYTCYCSVYTYNTMCYFSLCSATQNANC